MTTCLVTGAAGFIGSHLCEALLTKGHRVVGLDGFIPYYPRALKEQNLGHFRHHPAFSFQELDLRTDTLEPMLEGVDVIFHLAAMAGLLRSWPEFDSYVSCNITATQRLLEAARKSEIKHFIFGSTSSAYGRFATEDEDAPTQPISPYGITKLAAEHLCLAYASNYGLATTILRFFSVYGPRQRPDMGYNIFIRSLLNRELITIQGDGNDSRSNTYVLDCVKGIQLAFEQPEKSIGEIFNIGGGDEVSVNQVLAMLESFVGYPALTQHGDKRPGDQKRTAANIEKARRLLGYQPTTSIEEGLRNQLAWQMQQAE